MNRPKAGLDRASVSSSSNLSFAKTYDAGSRLTDEPHCAYSIWSRLLSAIRSPELASPSHSDTLGRTSGRVA
jgi:hypothetical protein